MRTCSIFLATIILNLTSLAVVASPSDALDKEYDQVRKIALRDPKVRDAFQKANERLEAKIIEIDPSLKGYKSRDAATSAKVPAKTDAASHRQQHPTVKPAPRTTNPNTHVIATGDTFSSIAARYKVTVAELKSANPSVDEKKLRIGKKLIIPAGSHRASSPEPEKTSRWGWLKSKF